MDPAGPFFESFDARVKLDPSDAKFVDVIHSNGDDVITGSFGTRLPCGHVDFYPVKITFKSQSIFKIRSEVEMLIYLRMEVNNNLDVHL